MPENAKVGAVGHLDQGQPFITAWPGGGPRSSSWSKKRLRPGRSASRQADAGRQDVRSGTPADWMQVQNEKRITDTLELVMNQHRLVVSPVPTQPDSLVRFQD